ncbi:MAG: Chromosome partition protein Smc [Gammaproteobacteria bacterium]|nr:Chromosome partition protein Smc [Gammaproteobacteria bacterium]
MRINKVRIAGFKSFVDTTSLEFRRNLSGIVGPNGCGKSNIIDAIQWVMGESSAKHLRGDSMADVIFNGSGTRKPVSQASVELIFDNSDGKIGGQYAPYSEISVRRQVGRDGQSSYFLNGARCRRRDITGLFLGTGTGARSYSIIEQGMISRVIEARPEDLRAFLEEAAGISKYKERRRETENRIRNTQENLARIADIATELDKQLQHLQRQARSAERYQELRAEERATQSQLHALRWRSLDGQLAVHRKDIERRTNAVEATTVALRAAEAEIIRQRDAQIAATDHFNAVQSRFYAVGAEVARLEQQMQHAIERRQAMERELGGTESGLEEARRHIAEDEQRLASLLQELAALEPDQARHSEAEQGADRQVVEAELRLNEWQLRWDAFNQRLADAQRQAHVEQTRREHLEDAIEVARQRLESLRRERAGLVPESLRGALAELERRFTGSQGSHAALQAEHEQLRAELTRLRQSIDVISSQLDERRQQRQQLSGRIASLEALQQSSLGTDREGLAQWLSDTGMAETPRLSELIEVEDGWEHAVETAALVPLATFCVPALQPLFEHLPALRDGSAAALDTSRRDGNGPRRNPVIGLPLLADGVHAPWPIGDLFDGVYAAETLEAAWRAVPDLGPGESVITRDGTWFGAGWVKVNRDMRAADGLLRRTQELKALQGDRARIEAEIDALQGRMEEVRTQLAALDAREAALRGQLDAAQETMSLLRSEVSAGQTRLEQMTQRLAQLFDESQELEEQVGEEAAELSACSERLASMTAQRDTLEGERAQLGEERERLRAVVATARQQWQSIRDAGHALTARIGAIHSERATLEQSLGRNRTQIARLQQQIAGLHGQLQGFGSPQAQLQAERETALGQRLEVEVELSSTREALQQADARLRALEQQRHTIEAEAGHRREELEQARLDARGLETRLESIVEQLAAAEAVAEHVIEALSPDATEAAWEERLAEIGRKIQRLGPINLAAIEECDTLAERKSYLDAQLADLNEALATLGEAIRKIDRETRTRFRETFDKVNSGFQTLFPALFGGGHAVLELTGEDLLETGVTVIARPPGKRNSTIHLLSGGEKALTAVALVFAIFELNPAPFCLLDEVDAPLDDANVVRLCEMLKQRARDIQFIFITHNKITMEIADELLGVTMQEAGVSRLVSVNMDEAVRLAATG